MKNKVKKILKISLIIIIILGGSIMFIDHIYSSADYKAKDINTRRIQNSPQFEKGKFRNKAEWKKPSTGNSVSTMWDFMFSDNQRKPKVNLPFKKVNLEFFKNTDTDFLSATWLGHSSIMINIDSYKILRFRYLYF